MSFVEPCLIKTIAAHLSFSPLIFVCCVSGRILLKGDNITLIQQVGGGDEQAAQ